MNMSTAPANPAIVIAQKRPLASVRLIAGDWMMAWPTPKFRNSAKALMTGPTIA